MPDSVVSDVTRRMLCGGVAGMVAKTVTNPLERIKMLSQTGEHATATTNARAIYRTIVASEGFIGLWAGNGANLLRVFPSKAVVFSSHDAYRKWLETSGWVSDPTLASFIAGGLAGSTATAVTYPLDLARGRISGKIAQVTGGKVYNSVWSAFAVTLRDEGVRGLYRGVTATLIGAMPYMGIQFGTVGILEQHLLEEGEKPSPLQKLTFGGLGGVAAGVITYPNDTVRRLLQLQGSRGTVAVYAGYWDCVRQTIRGVGISRLYQGVGINVLRMAPNSAVQFGTYEVLKRWTSPLQQ